eukprot:346186_1
MYSSFTLLCNVLIIRSLCAHNYKNRYFSGIMQIDDPVSDSISTDAEAHSDKEQLIAFLLSLTLGCVGAGRFYIGDYGFGSLKLILNLLVLVGPFIALCCILAHILNADTRRQSRFDDIFGVFGMCLPCYLLMVVSTMIWLIVDIVKFALNDIPDGDGLTLIPM